MINEKNSIIFKAFITYLVSIIVSAVFIPLFIKFYDSILDKSNVGYGLFFGRQEELIVGGYIFAYTLFLPLIIFIFVGRKKWLVWLIGIIFPAYIIFSEGKDILWFVIFTIAGGVIGWLIKFGIKKFKKA